MPKKRHKAEEIVAKLRQVEVLTARVRSSLASNIKIAAQSCARR